MKLNRLETHDRLLHFKKDQSINISKGAEDCLKSNSLSLAMQQFSPYVYLFAHPRTADDGVTKRMIWQPRLTKPSAQTNSYLFRAQSNTDIMEVCWLLPPQDTWGQYKKGNVTESDVVNWSIGMFKTNRELLEKSYPDDLTDDQARDIYFRIAQEQDEEKRIKKLYNLDESGNIKQ